MIEIDNKIQSNKKFQIQFQINLKDSMIAVGREERFEDEINFCSIVKRVKSCHEGILFHPIKI